MGGLSNYDNVLKVLFIFLRASLNVFIVTILNYLKRWIALKKLKVASYSNTPVDECK